MANDADKIFSFYSVIHVATANQAKFKRYLTASIDWRIEI